MSNPDPSAAISVRREHIERRNRRWFANYIPAHEVYCAAARRAARRDDAILHLGGGHDSLGVEASLGGLARRLVCVDPDLNGLRRNRGRLKVGGDGEQLPFRSGLFDLILAENVFEHLPCPRAVLAECRRCLRPGGRLIFLCPNRYGYIYMISAALPYRLHT